MALHKGEKCTNIKDNGRRCTNEAEYETPAKWCFDCWAHWWASVTKTSVDHVKRQMARLEIPPIPKRRVLHLVETIRPVVERDGTLWYVGPCDPWKASFTWSERLIKRAGDIEPITTIRTLHTWTYYGFFKPSIAEVLAFLDVYDPGDDFQELGIVAFSTKGPENASEMMKDKAAFDAGFHVGETTLYRRKR